jgi:hypothetical protein
MIRSFVRFCALWLFVFLSVALPLEAGAAETCLLDGRGRKASDVTNCTVGGGACGSSISVNNAKGLQLNAGTAQTPVDVHGRCRYIDNSSSSSYFVPLKSSEEWEAFLAHPPSGVSLSKCAKPFSGQNVSQGLLFGPSSAQPGMGDTGATTADVSLPYWRTGKTWPTSGASCSGATHTFSHSCYEEVPTSHCWKWVPRTCTGSRCTGTNDKGVCISTTPYTYDCTYCADTGSTCTKNWTNWSETFSFLATALDSDTYQPSWGQGQSTRTSGSTRPDSQCTQRCTYDGHDCTNCAGALACLPNGSVTCKNEVLYDSCGAKVGTCEEACVPTGTTSCKDNVEYDSCGTELGSCLSCKPDTETQTVACPTGQTGTHTQKRDYTCATVLADEGWGDWYDVTNTCKAACTPASQTQTVSCPSGQTGTHTQKRDYTCPDERWGSWYDVTNTCASSCTPTSQTQYVACPSGQTGVNWQRSDYTCPAATWSAWYDVTNTCKTSCVATSETKIVTCPTGQTGIHQQKRDYTCPAATWGSWYDTVNTCRVSCTPTSQTQAVSCPSGQTGTHTQKRDYTCPAATWTAWYDVTNTCKAACTPTSQTQAVSCPSGQTGTHTQKRDYTCPAAT